MDHHRNLGYPMAAWFLWSEYQFKAPSHRQLDSHPDRDRAYSHRTALAWSGVILQRQVLHKEVFLG
jgi:hypothetical protein